MHSRPPLHFKLACINRQNCVLNRPERSDLVKEPVSSISKSNKVNPDCAAIALAAVLDVLGLVIY